MNKLMLWGVIVTVVMLASTWLAVGGSKGGMGEDIVNQLAVGGAVALVIITVFVVIKYVRQMQSDTASGELADENWDGIGEYKNELPFGWSIMFLLTIIWGFWYFIAGYPVNAYSQIGEYNEDSAAENAKFAQLHQNMSQEDRVDMGQSIFIVQCAACHGLSADGIDGKAANLNVRLEEVVVKDAVENGSATLGYGAPMPDRNGLFNMNTGALITDAEIAAVSKYVAKGMKGEGADIFAGTCAACHGEDGKGMEFVAPNVAEFTPDLVATVLKHGKKGAIGAMPAFNNFTEPQIKALGAYVSSLK